MSTALNCQHCFRYVQETLISFPLILFALCLLCMLMIRLDTLDGSSWHIYFLDRMWVSLQNPLICCNEVTSRRTCTALLRSAFTRALHSVTTETNEWLCACDGDGDVTALDSYNVQLVSFHSPLPTDVVMCSHCMCCTPSSALRAFFRVNCIWV